MIKPGHIVKHFGYPDIIYIRHIDFVTKVVECTKYGFMPRRHITEWLTTFNTSSCIVVTDIFCEE